jgi:hypothetical protein
LWYTIANARAFTIPFMGTLLNRLFGLATDFELAILLLFYNMGLRFIAGCQRSLADSRGLSALLQRGKNIIHNHAKNGGILWRRRARASGSASLQQKHFLYQRQMVRTGGVVAGRAIRRI